MRWPYRHRTFSGRDLWWPLVILRWLSPAASVPLLAAAAVCAGLVVLGPRPCAGENLEGLHYGSKVFDAATFVWMRLERPLFIGSADVRRIGRLLYSQRGVVVRDAHVFVSSWGSSSEPSFWAATQRLVFGQPLGG